MSDRLAVFNRGRIEQVGTPADVYERPATRFVAGFVGTSNLLSGDVRARRSSARPGTFTVRPEKIHLARPGRRRPGRTRASATGTIREVVYLGPGHPLHRGARRRGRARRHPAEPGDLVDGGARGRRAGRSGSSGSGSTACPSRTGAVEPDATDGGIEPMSRSEEDRMKPRSALAALVVARVHRRGVRHAVPRRHRALPTVGRRRRGRADGPGLAGLRRERLDRPGGRLGHAVRGCHRLQGHRPGLRDVGRGVQPVLDEPREVRRHLRLGRRQPAARPGRLRPAGQRRPRPELRRHLPGPQGQAVQHRRRRPLRHPARPRLEPADVAHRRGRRRPRRPGPRCSTRRRRTPARSPSTTPRSTSPTPPSS